MRGRVFFLTGLVFASPLFALAAADFPGVPAAHPDAPAIQALKDAGIVSGYGDGTFKPDQFVSRAEAVAIILKAVGITATKTEKKLSFTDVAETAWYFPMIQKGVAVSNLKGYPDKTFRPDNPVTLPEALALTLSLYRVGTANVDVEPVIYEGLDAKAWYSKQAQFAKNKNLIEPDAQGRMDPAKPLTRAGLAQLIFRMRAFQQTQQPYDITTGWVTTEHLENFWKIRHPAGWEVFKGLKNSAMWKPTSLQSFFSRLWPGSARLSLLLKDNPENLAPGQYFAKLKETYAQAYPAEKIAFSETTLSGRAAFRISIPARGLMDAAIGLPNRQFLLLSGEYGEATSGLFLKKQLELVIGSYAYVEKPPEPPKPVIPLEQRMETLRENILVADQWKNLAPLFPDKKLIHTDAIGVGTGPVDYYASKEANHTLKLERNSGTVLNIREGETYAF